MNMKNRVYWLSLCLLFGCVASTLAQCIPGDPPEHSQAGFFAQWTTPKGTTVCGWNHLYPDWTTLEAIGICNDDAAQFPNAVLMDWPTIEYNCFDAAVSDAKEWLVQPSFTTYLEDGSYCWTGIAGNGGLGQITINYFLSIQAPIIILYYGGNPGFYSHAASWIFNNTVASKWGEKGDYCHDMIDCPYWPASWTAYYVNY
jgi:hypothetical protein